MERSRKQTRLAWVGSNGFFLNLGWFQSESLAAGHFARPRPQPRSQEKSIGLERFQPNHPRHSAAGPLSEAVSKRLQHQAGLFL